MAAIDDVNAAAKTIQEKIQEALVILVVPAALLAVGLFLSKRVKTNQHTVTRYRGYDITSNREKLFDKPLTSQADAPDPPQLWCNAWISSPIPRGDPVGFHSEDAVTCAGAVAKVKKHIDKMLKKNG